MLARGAIGILHLVLRAGVLRCCDALHGRHLVECLLRDVRIVVHAKEETEVEHALEFRDLEKVTHILNQFVLQLISTLLVTAQSIALLRQNRHVVTDFFKAVACEFDDKI